MMTWLVLLGGLLVWFTDRVLKTLALQKILSGEGPGFFINQQIAFSLPLPNTAAVWIVSGLTLVLLVIAVLNYRRSTLLFLGAGLAVLGSASNLLDRLYYHGVVDYINLGWWPVFNLADVLVVFGLGIIALAVITKQRPT